MESCRPQLVTYGLEFYTYWAICMEFPVEGNSYTARQLGKQLITRMCMLHNNNNNNNVIII
jgi:hypothetical protein